MLGIVISWVGLASVPMLMYFAWNGWARGVRTELSEWRNATFVAAFLLLLLNWLGAAILEGPILFNPGFTRPQGLMDAMLTLSHPLDLIAMVFGFALRRGPRVQMIAAGLAMMIAWPVGYV